MAITKTQFVDKVKRRLGAPAVKIEICDDQIVDHLDYARQKYTKWAIGNATQEVFFTVLLEGGKRFYNLPNGIHEVISYDDQATAMGGINTLFTLDNFLYSRGYFNNMFFNGYDLVSYHMAMDFLSTLKRYIHSKYTYRYHHETNQIEITPTPAYGNSLNVTMNSPVTGLPTEYVVDSPGWVLVRAYMYSGASLPNKTYEWDNVLREKKTMIEQRTLTADEVENKAVRLKHKPYVNDLDDLNNPEDVHVNVGGVDQLFNVDWMLHRDNQRVVYWDDLGLDGDVAEGDTMTITYPTIIFAPYYPSEWTNVTSVHYEQEDITVTQTDLDYGYLSLQADVWDDGNADQISITVGGVDQELDVDYRINPHNRKIVLIKNMGLDGVLEVGDIASVQYTTVLDYTPDSPSTAVGTSYDRQYITKIENRIITAQNIIDGYFDLNEALVVPDGMTFSIGGTEKRYGLDFTVIEDTTPDNFIRVSWTGYPLEGVIAEGDRAVVTYTSSTPLDREYAEEMYDNDWMLDYVTALTKISLGMIRRKFANFNAMGGSGISLDGDSLVSEGVSEKENLETTLRDEEAYEGLGILIG